jgi:hypothetical protein
MEEMTVLAAGVGAVSVTAPFAWMAARGLAGVLSSPSWKAHRRVAGAVGLVLVATSIALRPVWTILIPLMVFGIVGIAAGAAAGWMTRDPQDRDRY